MSAQLFFEVTHQIINRKDTFKPATDTKNYLRAHFDFLTPEWTGAITAIFTKGDQSYEMLLEDNECFVPWELLAEGGDIFVSCFCDGLVTSSSSRIFVADSGYLQGGNGEQ